MLEDNQCTILSAEVGYSKRLRHLPRTYRNSIAWLPGGIGSLDCMLVCVKSEFQAADTLNEVFLKWR